MGITWGIWVSPTAQRRANWMAIAFGVGTASGIQTVNSTGFTPNTGQWFHVAGVHDTSAGPNRSKLYINGVLNNTAPSEATLNTNSNSLYFGIRDGTLDPANAKLDEIRISSRVVPVDELGYSHVLGPPEVIWADSYET